MKNHYITLDISPTATLEEIKHSYRTLAKKYHPDRNPNKDSALKFIAVKEAYEILINVERKKSYDFEFNKIFGQSYFKPNKEENRKKYNEIQEVRIIQDELKKYNLENAMDISLEEIKKSLSICKTELSKLKIRFDYESYLDISSTVVRNYLDIAKNIQKFHLDIAIINPIKVFQEMPKYVCYEVALENLKQDIDFMISPLRDFDMDKFTKRSFEMYIAYILELKADLARGASNKDSDSNKKCYIATLAYGSENHYAVETFRNYRDNRLNRTITGRLFIKLYYAISPHLVKHLRKMPKVILKTRKLLDLIICQIKKQEKSH